MGKHKICTKALKRVKEFREEIQRERQNEQDFRDCIMAMICPACGNTLDYINNDMKIIKPGETPKISPALKCSCGFKFDIILEPSK